MFQSTPSGGKATPFSIRWRRRLRGFNPRLPGGRRHYPRANRASSIGVSIHAFRGEGDDMILRIDARALRFNPRLPGGRRPADAPTWETGARVSIHAFRGEGDVRGQHRHQEEDCFNPRLPGGRRPVVPSCWPALILFQSTPSGGKATSYTPYHASRRSAFQSTPSGGKATC